MAPGGRCRDRWELSGCSPPAAAALTLLRVGEPLDHLALDRPSQAAPPPPPIAAFRRSVPPIQRMRLAGPAATTCPHRHICRKWLLRCVLLASRGGGAGKKGCRSGRWVQSPCPPPP